MKDFYRTYLLFTYLIFFCGNIFCQNHKLNSDSIQILFVSYLNSLRDEVNNQVNLVEVDSDASLGCLHHNRYLGNLQNDTLFRIITHNEPTSIGSYTYNGKDTLLNSFSSRINKYDISDDFHPIAEIVGSISLWYYSPNQKKIINFVRDYTTNELIAKKLFKSFVDSEEHYKIMTSTKYSKIAIDVSIFDGEVYLTMVTGVKKEIINGGLKLYFNKTP